MPALRAVVVDDSLLVRVGVRRVLEEAGLDVVAELVDAESLLETVARLQPDVVVTDIRMPPTRTDEGVRAALAIRARHPLTGVMVLSAFAEPDYVQQLLRDGSDGLGYLLKERVGDVADFVASIGIVARGGTVLDPAVVGLLMGEPTGQRAGASPANDRPQAPRAVEMDALILEHAAAWAREHDCGVARELRDGFVAVTPDGRHARHPHFYLALEWLEVEAARREQR
jgi:DNA-binding NarL/FixJ family response regulator